MISKVFASLFLLGSVLAAPQYNLPIPAAPFPVRPVGPVIPIAPGPRMPYEFAYGVNDALSGNDFGHSESSDGAVTRGQYTVLLPDGRRQTVTYTADALNGYQANVAYEGTALFPAAGPVGPIGPVIPVAPRPGYGFPNLG